MSRIHSGQDRLVVGLTGSFGSGCSRLKESLVNLGFEPFSLSKFVKDAWCKQTRKPIEKARRKDLQDIGDSLREKNKKPITLQNWQPKKQKRKVRKMCH